MPFTFLINYYPSAFWAAGHRQLSLQIKTLYYLNVDTYSVTYLDLFVLSRIESNRASGH